MKEQTLLKCSSDRIWNSCRNSLWHVKMLLWLKRRCYFSWLNSCFNVTVSGFHSVNLWRCFCHHSHATFHGLWMAWHLHAKWFFTIFSSCSTDSCIVSGGSKAQSGGRRSVSVSTDSSTAGGKNSLTCRWVDIGAWRMVFILLMAAWRFAKSSSANIASRTLSSWAQYEFLWMTDQMVFLMSTGNILCNLICSRKWREPSVHRARHFILIWRLSLIVPLSFAAIILYW